tara:strand:+ start:206 stop:346 length:141 start_codon:yes stop_codon:yes gene_type:complete
MSDAEHILAIFSKLSVFFNAEDVCVDAPVESNPLRLTTSKMKFVLE